MAAAGHGHTTANIVDISGKDALFARIRSDAQDAVRVEPDLAGFLFANVLHHDSLERAIIHRVAARLDHADLGADSIAHAYTGVIAADPSIVEAFRADILAVFDRDPACKRLIEPLLYFKGFHAIQTHRLAHALYKQGRRDFAMYLQSRSSAVFGVDINPAAKFGKGIFVDHATGLVVGETAEVGDDVSILHGVTLGGTGKEVGDRHPKIRNGVLLAAGAKVLGNIEVGHCARVAAGSVVLADVPHNTTVAGVPARVVGTAGCAEPGRTMDQIFAEKSPEI
ncbi:MAG: serine O-acetyltransferase [Hyphomicrobiales bacterium]|nr:serine O-acetyltransferase [Hyphomicrobiales bacterium]